MSSAKLFLTIVLALCVGVPVFVVTCSGATIIGAGALHESRR